MQQNFLTDPDNRVFGSITEDQLLMYGFLFVLAIIIASLIGGFIKKKNEPHIKTTTKEI